MTDAAVSPPRIVATCRDYGELIAALRCWFSDQMNCTYKTIDLVAGLPVDYAAKVFAPVPIRRLGATSLGPILGAAGLELQLVVNEAQLARILQHSQFKTRSIHAPYSRQHTNRGVRTNSKRNKGWWDSEVGKIMRARGMLKTTPAQRRRWAKAAIAARWSRE